jgi:hypothetical protein
LARHNFDIVKKNIKKDIIAISAKEGTGLHKLIKSIAKRLY